LGARRNTAGTNPIEKNEELNLYPSGKTGLIALLADPVDHVRAPEFANPVFERRGIDAFLFPLHVRPSDLEDVVPRLAKLGNLKGAIVTIPHKETMARLCHTLGENGRMVGVVNVVRFDPGGHLAGDMYDGPGLIAAAKTNAIALTGRRVLVVGTGGAGRAIAFALAGEKVVRLGLANRTPSRAETLAADIRAAFPAVDVIVCGPHATDWDVVINATSLGLHAGDPMPLDMSSLSPRTAFIDIIAPRVTEAMDAAQAKGCRVVGGRPMVELQLDAQLAFLGLTPPVSAGGKTSS
jgi:shikimate dehydrogenase